MKNSNKIVFSDSRKSVTSEITEILPAPYNGRNYEIHLTKYPMGYGVSIYMNTEYQMGLKGYAKSKDEAMREASHMIIMSDKTKPKISNASGNDVDDSYKWKVTLNENQIKLTWVDKKDYRTLHSQMFSTLNDALESAKDKRNWLVFQLTKLENGEYYWKLLPHGKSGAYVRNAKLNDKPLLRLFLYGMAAVGIYFVGKSIYKYYKNQSSLESVPLPPTPNPVPKV
jgi:hypothetical protein